MPRVSIMYDLENNIVVDGFSIYDRGYLSMGVISYHDKNSIDFLMRVNNKSFGAVQKFIRSKKSDEIIEIEVTPNILRKILKKTYYPQIKQLNSELKVGNKIRVRAIKVILGNGNIEVLLTSLLSQDIYKTEISYNILKNIFDIENFIGLTQIAINQEI